MSKPTTAAEAIKLSEDGCCKHITSGLVLRLDDEFLLWKYYDKSREVWCFAESPRIISSNLWLPCPDPEAPKVERVEICEGLELVRTGKNYGSVFYFVIGEKRPGLLRANVDIPILDSTTSWASRIFENPPKRGPVDSNLREAIDKAMDYARSIDSNVYHLVKSLSET